MTIDKAYKMDASEAFRIARKYLTGDPIYADYDSVKPVLVVPRDATNWYVTCDYKHGAEKERAVVMINDQGQVATFFKI